MQSAKVRYLAKYYCISVWLLNENWQFHQYPQNEQLNASHLKPLNTKQPRHIHYYINVIKWDHFYIYTGIHQYYIAWSPWYSWKHCSFGSKQQSLYCLKYLQALCRQHIKKQRKNYIKNKTKQRSVISSWDSY